MYQLPPSNTVESVSMIGQDAESYPGVSFDLLWCTNTPSAMYISGSPAPPCRRQCSQIGSVVPSSYLESVENVGSAIRFVLYALANSTVLVASPLFPAVSTAKIVTCFSSYVPAAIPVISTSSFEFITISTLSWAVTPFKINPFNTAKSSTSAGNTNFPSGTLITGAVTSLASANANLTSLNVKLASAGAASFNAPSAIAELTLK